METVSNILIKGLLAFVAIYLIVAPYVWWDKAREDRDIYKSQLEVSVILAPPAIEVI